MLFCFFRHFFVRYLAGLMRRLNRFQNNKGISFAYRDWKIIFFVFFSFHSSCSSDHFHSFSLIISLFPLPDSMCGSIKVGIQLFFHVRLDTFTLMMWSFSSWSNHIIRRDSFIWLWFSHKDELSILVIPRLSWSSLAIS